MDEHRHIRSDEGLTLETSAFQSLYGGQFTLSTSLINQIFEHRHTSSAIGKHFRDKHSSTPKDLTTDFTILKKCNSKFDCLIYEVFFINELRPSLNVQRDSIRAKVFK